MSMDDEIARVEKIAERERGRLIDEINNLKATIEQLEDEAVESTTTISGLEGEYAEALKQRDALADDLESISSAASAAIRDNT